MSKLPHEIKAFTEAVAGRFQEELPSTKVQVIGDLSICIDGHSVDLDDLHRAILHEEIDGPAMVLKFIDAYAHTRRLMELPLPFEVAASKILPQIRSLDRFPETPADFFANQPYVNDTAIQYVLDLNDAVTPLSTEQLIRWGVDVEEIDRIARKNLASHQPDLELKLFRGDDAVAAQFNTGDGYDAARLLLDQLHHKLAPEFGGNFLVAIPARDVFIAFPTGPAAFLQRLRERIEADYKSLPYPITSQLFLVTMDGVAEWRDAA